MQPAPRANVVLWTIKARRHLRRGRLAATDATDSPPADLDRILRDTFPGCDVVVQDEMLGFRPKPGQHVLLVEVCDPIDDRSGSHVVKVGPVEPLERELHGWRDCRPDGLRHDLVFLPLREGCRDPETTCPRRMSLVYGDAQQLIGVETTATLEAAALQSVRFGVPTVASVREVLVHLYERVGHLLYHVSAEDAPGRPGYRVGVRRLREALDCWDTQDRLRDIRVEIDNLVHRIDRTPGRLPSRRYLGPVAHLRWAADTAEGGGPRAADAVPPMLRGYAHGDLHGRNVLVGVVRERVLWPTLFDYEHMAPDGLLGWDFVKLETELKVRAYDAVFAPHGPLFVQQIHEFELDLADRTERHQHDRDWPAGPDGDAPADRLRAILLAVRQLASVHLGADRGRPQAWLQEYFFLLAAYGVVAGRFENLHRRELIGACLSAGVAAARLQWPRGRLREERLLLGLDGPATVTAPQALGLDTVSYDSLLELAQRWRLGGEPGRLADAAELLVGLKARYPLALEIGQELVLAELELNRTDLAHATLREVAGLLRHPNEEILCRWGRLFKEAGDHAAARPGGERLADHYYRLALGKYEEAYAIRLGHYPGVNRATMVLVRAALARRLGDAAAADEGRRQSAELADELLARRDSWPADQPDDVTVWHPATEAEALLLRQRWADAADRYRALAARPGQRKAMRKQIDRILACYRAWDVTDLGPFAQPERLFDGEPNRKEFLKI